MQLFGLLKLLDRLSILSNLLLKLLTLRIQIVSMHLVDLFEFKLFSCESLNRSLEFLFFVIILLLVFQYFSLHLLNDFRVQIA